MKIWRRAFSRDDGDITFYIMKMSRKYSLPNKTYILTEFYLAYSSILLLGHKWNCETKWYCIYTKLTSHGCFYKHNPFKKVKEAAKKILCDCIKNLSTTNLVLISRRMKHTNLFELLLKFCKTISNTVISWLDFNNFSLCVWLILNQMYTGHNLQDIWFHQI